MTPRKLNQPARLWLVCALAAVAIATFAFTATAGSNPGPDVTVIYLQSLGNNGSSGGMHGYSVGTTSCNIGDADLWWCDNDRSYCNDDQHPVIAQNLYRLKDDRFEQIGMSWLKHGFLSVNSTDSSCGPSCQSPPHGGDQLGVGCTDPYGAGLNGSRPLGMRSEVNAATGAYPFPYTNVGAGGVDQWIQVLDTDLEPAMNAGALYWVEGQYIAADDAAAGNGLNNASYRQVTVSPGSLNLNLTGATIREKAAIEVWPTLDPDVEFINVDVLGTIVERFHVARKVSPISGGNHYEYAVHNMNSDRSAHSFTIQFPNGTTISNAGFHDVPHHSGEPYTTTDWVATIDNGANTVTWETDDFATDNNANALRWGTMFSFWVDATGPAGNHTLGLFKPGVPSEMNFNFNGGSLFTDGFESGNTTAWTSTFP